MSFSTSVLEKNVVFFIICVVLRQFYYFVVFLLFPFRASTNCFVCPFFFPVQTGGGRVEVARLCLNVPSMFRYNSLHPLLERELAALKYTHSLLSF